MVSQGADMKVYVEVFEKHHETGGVLRQKNTVHLFTHTVAPYRAVSYCRLYTTFYIALLLSGPGLNSSQTKAGMFLKGMRALNSKS